MVDRQREMKSGSKVPNRRPSVLQVHPGRSRSISLGLSVAPDVAVGAELPRHDAERFRGNACDVAVTNCHRHALVTLADSPARTGRQGSGQRGPLPQRPHRLDPTPDELTGETPNPRVRNSTCPGWILAVRLSNVMSAVVSRR